MSSSRIATKMVLSYVLGILVVAGITDFFLLRKIREPAVTLQATDPLAAKGVEKNSSEIRRIFWLGVLGWLALSLALSRIYLSRLDEVLSRFRRLVAKFEKEEFSGLIPANPEDEFENMERWMSQMSLGMERKITELTRERNQLKAILDTMQEGVIVLDGAGNIALSNPAAKLLLELKDDAMGKSPIEVIRNADLQAMVDQSLEGREIKRREIRVLGRSQEKFLLVYATPLKDPTHHLGSILAFFDITNLKHLERVRRDFVANVSHEIKTPLTSIQGYIETLLEGADEDRDQAKKFLGVIDANARRLSKLVEDLLRLSEIESQQFILKLDQIDAGELVEEAIGLQEVQLKKREMKTEVMIEPKSLRIRSDRMALLHILGNLLSNAIKYGRPGTTVTVSIKGGPGQPVLFEVIDRGIGIEKFHLERIFERFYRVDKSRSPQEGGTGLGLSIAKHLVQLLGGEIWVSSRLAEGTTFSFTIPG